MNEIILPEAKSIMDIKISDFHDYFVWVETESIDDEDEVAPYLCQTLPDRNWIYYLLTDFLLADRSTYEGYIRWSYGKVTFVAIAHSNKEFIEYSLVSEIQKSIGDTGDTLATKLDRPVSSIFPISYQSKVGFHDEPIQGKIILE